MYLFSFPFTHAGDRSEHFLPPGEEWELQPVLYAFKGIALPE